MIEQQEEILIGKMLDCPESLTAQEIEIIAEDVELRELYEVSVSMRNSQITPIKTNKTQEWRRLIKRLLKFDKWTFKNMCRAAVIIIGTIFLEEVTDDSRIDLNL